MDGGRQIARRSAEIAELNRDSYFVNFGYQLIFHKLVASLIDAYYEVTLDIIRVLVNATDVRLRSGGPYAVSYEPWQDQQAARASLKDFFDLIGY